MKELLDKISSYNIFNYLFPGIVFALAADYLTSTSLVQENILEGLFLYYFLGLVISRIGSLVIEPILKKIRFINFADYSSFVQASKKDEKIELLSEVNNTYRTLISTFFLLLLLVIYDNFINITGDTSNYLLIIFLLIVFLFSYRKQTTFIVKRIKGGN
jgi:hypothetical protein